MNKLFQAIFVACISLLPLSIHAQTLFWDGGANDGLWCSAVNWGNQSGPDTNYNILPSSANTVLFRDISPPGNVQITCEAVASRVRLTSATVPRTLEIGTNEVVDRTLTISGSAAELLDLNNTGVGRDLIFSGTPNAGGYKLRLQINGTKPINVAATGSSMFISTEITGVGGFDKTGLGRLVLSGSNTYSGTTTISAGSVYVNSPGSLPAVSSVTVNSGGTLGGSGTVNGTVTVNAGGSLSPGASVGTLTLSSNLTLSGNLYIELNKSLSPSNDVIAVTGVLTNAGTGTVTVVNIGNVGLTVGDSFQLFNKPLTNGAAMTVVSPVGVVWTNKLDVDGSIAVLSVPPVSAATNVTITAVSLTNVSIGGQGLANTPYNIFATTNVALPMSSWSPIGTTNSDGSGIIQFPDSSPTNSQRFYRIGQTVP